MIDFACKQFDINEVIKCGLGLTRSEFKLMDYLVKNFGKTYDSNDLAKEMSLDKTTVQRALKKLHEKNVVKRMQKNLDGGGYVFYYEIKPKPELRKIIVDIVNNWNKNVEKALDQW